MRDTPFHLYKDCLSLAKHIHPPRGAFWTIPRIEHRRIIKAYRWGLRGYTREEIMRNLCDLCIAKADLDELHIDDFNSVWFGLGPDNCTAPLLAGAQ